MSRLVVFRISILLVFVLLVSQLYVLQFREGQRLAEDARGNTLRQVFERPIRGEIFAADGTTILAESLPSYTIGILRSRLPADERDKQAIFAWLDDLLQFQSTLVVTPAEQLTYEPRLEQDMELITGPFDTPPPSLRKPFTVKVPLGQSIEALALTRQYRDTKALEFHSPIEAVLDNASLPAYETVPLTTTMDLRIGRIIEENKSISPGLPGVEVETNYQRSYPRSAEVQSLSHMLGYVGPIDKCGIVEQNPERFWSNIYLTEPLTMTQVERKAALLDYCGLVEADLAGDAAGIRYLLTDRIGRDGLEKAYEGALRGQLGVQQVEVDVHERLVSEPQQFKPTKTGDNLVLSVDYELQKQTESILRKWIAESDRRRQNFPAPFENRRQYFPIHAGVAIAMEVKTGRILSMVSWPSYDNNFWNRNRSQEEVIKTFDPGYPWQAPAINQAIQGLYPPGSAWKQVAAAAALANGTITPETKIRDPGILYVKNTYFEDDPSYDQAFPNSIKRNNDWIDVRQALQVSSNVFFQSVMGGTQYVRNLKDEEKIAGLDERGEKLADMARAFGFGNPTGIPLPGEAGGIVPSASWKKQQAPPLSLEAWTIGETYNYAIGQGDLKVTPLQLLVASAAIANGGTLYQPQLVKQIVDADGHVVREIDPVVNGTLPVSSEHLQVIREGMRLAITDGLDVCARGDISGLEIAGKTGTAEYIEVIDPKIREYREENTRKRSHAWFVGYAPYDDPQIEVLVLVEGAGDMNDGSATVAVPAVTEIMQSYFKVQPPGDPAKPIPPQNFPCH